MSLIMDGSKVRELRKGRGWSIASAAEKAGIGEATWKRIEANKPPRREKVWSGVCRALEVERDAIRVGGRSASLDERERSSSSDRLDPGTQVQINARVSAQSKNAAAATAQRYGLTQTAIIEAAPLMFVILAERSLRERRVKLDEMRALVAQQEELADKMFHLDVNVFPRAFIHNALDAEQDSIERQDLFGRKIDAMMQKGHLDYEGIAGEDDEEINPFAVFLQREAEGIAGYVSFTEQGTRYSLAALFEQLLGPGDAADLAAAGSAPFHAMPKALLAPGKEEQARSWLIENCDRDALERFRAFQAVDVDAFVSAAIQAIDEAAASDGLVQDQLDEGDGQ